MKITHFREESRCEDTYVIMICFKSRVRKRSRLVNRKWRGISDIAHTISERVSCQLIPLIWSHFFEIFKFWIARGTWFLLSEIVIERCQKYPPQNMADPFTWTRERLRCFRVVCALFCEKTCGKRATKNDDFVKFSRKMVFVAVSCVSEQTMGWKLIPSFPTPSTTLCIR